MTPNDTEQGRMNIWDKAFSFALQGGKDVDAAIQAAEKAVDAFEARFHADMVAARKELGGVLQFGDKVSNAV
jgi:hypothetical protein